MTTEAEWQTIVVELAQTWGWRVNHTYRGRVGKSGWRTNTTVKGFPDLMLWKPGDLLFAELKTDKGSLRPEQNDVLASLKAAGVDVYVWAPRDLEHVTRRLGAT